jgi:hypothetical protein
VHKNSAMYAKYLMQRIIQRSPGIDKYQI